MHLNVEKYGKSNWSTWKDKDLKLGGRVVVNQDGQT